MIVIIGAGIAGLSLARELAEAGAPVTVFDAGPIAGGASGVASCYLEPRLGRTPMRQLEREALARWDGYATYLEEMTGLPTGLRTEGQLRVALPDDADVLNENSAVREAEGGPLNRIGIEEARRRESSLSEALTEAVHLPHVRWVNGRQICTALAHGIRSAGGTIVENRSVEAISGSFVHLAGGSAIEARAVVLCNGMGVNRLEGRPDDVPLARPVRGVNLLLDMSGLDQPIRHMIKHRRGNMVPVDDRTLIVGTTHENGEDSLVVGDEVVERLYAHAEPVLPIVRDLPLIGVNAGLRTKVADGQLRLSRSAMNPAVFYSLGHAGSGFLRAPAIAPGFARYILTGEGDAITTPLLT